MGIKARAVRWGVVLLLPVAGLAADSDRLLVEAAKNQDAETVRSLLKQHVDVNARLEDGATALAWATHWNDVDTADLLMSAGADVNAANDYGVGPLFLACVNANAGMVEKLLKAGAAPNATQPTGETALMRCARTGDPAAVKSMLDHGADVGVKEPRKGQTALMWALEEQHADVVRVLLEHGADVHSKSKSGFMPLLFAARHGDVESARLLLEKGADVNETTPGGLSALLLAADSGREQFAIFLLEKGANPNAADRDGLTALHYALRKGMTLLRATIDGNKYQPYMFRPNMSALAKALLDHGANPNARIVKGGRIPLQVSDKPMLSLDGATPFLLAAATGDVGLMRALLVKGADPKLATDDHTTPLMVAAGVGRGQDRTKEEEKSALEALKLVLELGGADVNAANTDGHTALHAAAFTGANEILQFLVEKGARMDQIDKWGQTALSIAEGDPNHLAEDFERRSHPKTAELIRRLGGDPQGAGAAFAGGVVAPQRGLVSDLNHVQRAGDLLDAH